MLERRIKKAEASVSELEHENSKLLRQIGTLKQWKRIAQNRVRAALKVKEQKCR